MASETDVITIELEIDAANGGATELHPGILWQDPENPGGVVIELVEAEAGHGFGISEMVTIVATISAGASSQLVADAIRAGIGKVIRTAKAKSNAHSDGSREGLAKLVEGERASSPDKSAGQSPAQAAVDGAVNAAESSDRAEPR
jgi:hypothetical protein